MKPPRRLLSENMILSLRAKRSNPIIRSRLLRRPDLIGTPRNDNFWAPSYNRVNFILPLICFILYVCNLSFAADKGFVVDADSVSYQKEKGIIEASGSVDASYRKINVKAPHIVYFTKQSRITADRGFYLNKDKLLINGNKLDYLVKTEKGSAEGVKISAGASWISGESVTIDPEEVYLKNASFSSCGLEKPHYKISSSSMTYYPKSGWIVEYLGLFWINNVPVFPVPTYVFDAGSKYKKNIAPLPEFGSNNVDGTYLKEKVVWRLSSFSYGMLSLDYASLKGFGLGFEGNYVANDNNEGSVRLSTYGIDGFSGGLSHTFYFGDNVPYEQIRYQLYEVLQAPPKKKYDAAIDVSYRERVNYERVSFLPLVTLRYIDVPFSFLDFSPKVEVSLGSVSEESTGVSLFKGNIKTNLDYSQPLPNDYSLLTGVDASYSAYGQTRNWATLLGRAGILKNINPNIETGLGYSHYFINDGSSPFRYENYRYFPFDEIRAHLLYKMGLSSFGVFLSYNSPLLTVRDIDYNATIGMHCYDISLTWRAARNEFTFGLTLASR